MPGHGDDGHAGADQDDHLQIWRQLDSCQTSWNIPHLLQLGWDHLQLQLDQLPSVKSHQETIDIIEMEDGNTNRFLGDDSFC